uniref:C-C motif chemokine n=1 Tax=Astyanax mexicanus TaxID=7994 RepID=A0A3B1IP29_ASTMX
LVVVIVFTVFTVIIYYCYIYYVNAGQRCCFHFFSSKIPLNAIIKYENVHRGCPISGVIFTTWKSRKLCAHKNQSWVQRAMNEIDQRPFKGTNSSSTGSAAICRGLYTVCVM